MPVFSDSTERRVECALRIVNLYGTTDDLTNDQQYLLDRAHAVLADYLDMDKAKHNGTIVSMRDPNS